MNKKLKTKYTVWYTVKNGLFLMHEHDPSYIILTFLWALYNALAGFMSIKIAGFLI